MPRRPGLRRLLKSHFSATSRRCHRIKVSGETSVSTSRSAFRPIAFCHESAFLIAESAALATQPFLQHPVVSLKELNDVQLAMRPAKNVISRNASSGDTEIMPEVYRTCRSSFWTARPHS
jgi:hypothetical protein